MLRHINFLLKKQHKDFKSKTQHPNNFSPATSYSNHERPNNYKNFIGETEVFKITSVFMSMIQCAGDRRRSTKRRIFTYSNMSEASENKSKYKCIKDDL